MLWHHSGGRCITDNSNFLWLRVELCCLDLYFALSCRICPRVVSKIDQSRLKALDVTSKRTDMDLRMWLNYINLVLKVNWAVTFHLKLLCVGLADQTAATHVNEFWKELILS